MAVAKIFTKEFTDKIAKLSNIQLTSTEDAFLTSQFNRTLSVIEDLESASTKSTKEAYSTTGLKNVLREDNVDKNRILAQKDVFANAKEVHNGFFVVKGVLNEK